MVSFGSEWPPTGLDVRQDDNHRRMLDAAAVERFWSKVNKSGPVHPTLGTRCWLWTAGLLRNGYGQLRWFDGTRWRTVTAHRFVWTINDQPLAAGECSLHKCDVRNCVNIDHLFRGTRGDNNRDGFAKGRIVAPPPSYGERNCKAKFSVAHAEEIRSRRTAGEPSARLAAEYGVSRETVNNIASGRTWKPRGNLGRL